MTRDRFVAVVNPAAGSGAAATVAIRLARSLRELGAEVRVAYSRSLSHAASLAAEVAGDGAAALAGDGAAALANGGATVLAVGGDGLLGAVAGALAGTGTELAVIPAGRGNDLARAFPPPTASALLSLPSRPVDVAYVNGRVVVGSVCAGLDAAANHAANRWRLPRRPYAYQLAAAAVLVSWRPIGYRLLVDGSPMNFRGHTVVVANCPWYGGGLKVAPAARLDDGHLDLITVAAIGRHRLLPVLAAMRRGTHTALPGIRCHRVREIVIDTDRPTPVYADGERLPPPPLTIKIRPAFLRVVGA
jgi:diacylglycerol kinase (ATP)